MLLLHFPPHLWISDLSEEVECKNFSLGDMYLAQQFRLKAKSEEGPDRPAFCPFRFTMRPM
jgi:hypothetical protein